MTKIIPMTSYFKSGLSNEPMLYIKFIWGCLTKVRDVHLIFKDEP